MAGRNFIYTMVHRRRRGKKLTQIKEEKKQWEEREREREEGRDSNQLCVCVNLCVSSQRLSATPSIHRQPAFCWLPVCCAPGQEVKKRIVWSETGVVLNTLLERRRGKSLQSWLWLCTVEWVEFKTRHQSRKEAGSNGRQTYWSDWSFRELNDGLESGQLVKCRAPPSPESVH